MKRLTIMITTLGLMLGMAQCRKNVEQIVPGGQTPASGEKVYVTMTASCGGDRTEIEQNGINGIVNWTSGDRLYVVGSSQGCLGYLEPVNYTSASDVANFSGSITALTSQQTLHFYYFGKNTTLYNGTDNTYTYSIATQTGTLDGIENTMHLMHGSTANVAAGTTSFGTIAMENMMAIAKFNLSAYTQGQNPKCWELITSCPLNLKTGSWGTPEYATIANNNPVVLSGVSANYYMALIPSSSAQNLVFCQDNSADVTLSRTIAAGKLYTQGGNSITVSLGAVEGTTSGHSWVDFNCHNMGLGGLPRWAKYNLGAESPEDYGDYYAWGETTCYNKIPSAYPSGWTGSTNSSYLGLIEDNRPKRDYSWDYYKWGTYSSDLFKYNSTDGKTTLESADDAATANWGNGWSMPTEDEFSKLIDKTTWTWKAANDPIEINGVSVSVPAAGYYCVSSKTGYTSRYIFLPAAGYRIGSDLSYAVSNGLYWSSSLNTSSPDYGRSLLFGSSSFSMFNSSRYLGCTVRPVRASQE